MIRALLSILCNLLLSLSSYSMVLVFYLACVDIPFVRLSLHPFAKVITLFVLAILLAVFCLWLIKTTIKTIDATEITRIRPIESVAMPTYIGLFVISLGITSLDVSIAIGVLLILFIFWRFFEKVFYFNPIWGLFGYRFYEIETSGGNTMTLITKKPDLKHKEDLSNLKRINNYTFMEMK